MLRYAVLLTMVVASPALAQSNAAEAFPEPDPLVGDYVGRWEGDVEVDPDVAAQVIALGHDRYQINIVSKLDMRCPVQAVIEEIKTGNFVEFEKEGHYGKIENDEFIGGRGREKFQMKKALRLSPTLGAAAPPDATVLFNGGTLDAWSGTDGWEVTPEGFLMVTPDGEYLQTKEHYKDSILHIEFRTPFMPLARGQQRGNSGVFFQDVYEVQVLDTYGLPGYYDECGGLYKVSAPKVNACSPPLQWQTYDIKYEAPVWDADGKLEKNPRMTVWHNGVLIHDRQEMWWVTAWTEKERKADHQKDPGPIKLQGHNNYVQFKNIWMVQEEPKGWPFLK